MHLLATGADIMETGDFYILKKTIIWKLLPSLIVDHHYSTDWWRINKEGYIIKSKNERSRLWRSNIGQFNRCKEANYDKAISSKQFDDCTNAVIRILPRIDLSGINKLIDSVEHLSQMQKEFIKESWNLEKKFFLMIYLNQLIKRHSTS